MSLLTGLISYWKLDEESGNAIDSHGSNTLTETSGTIDAAIGIISGARDFEVGDTECFEIADNVDLSTGDIDFEIQAWVKFESVTGVQLIVCKDNAGSNREYALYFSTNRINFFVSANGTTPIVVTANNFGALSTSVWYFIHAWHDATANEIGVSVNNGTPNTKSHTTGVFDGSSPFRIGAHQATFINGFDGLINEVGFWKRILTSDERTALYNGGAGMAYPFGSSGRRRMSAQNIIQGVY